MKGATLEPVGFSLQSMSDTIENNIKIGKIKHIYEFGLEPIIIKYKEKLRDKKRGK